MILFNNILKSKNESFLLDIEYWSSLERKCYMYTYVFFVMFTLSRVSRCRAFISFPDSCS